MLKVIALGGLGEIGLNMMLFEHQGQILVIDAGLMFPDDYMPGVDIVIPDFNYLRENRDKLLGIILTHGHEDHIGATPFLLKEFKLPVFGTRFTLALLREKLREHRFSTLPPLHQVTPGHKSHLGPFVVEYIQVNHSIVDGVGLAIETDEGTFIHSGDFKIDSTPVDGQLTDIGRFAHYGEKGVLALFSDSTNAEKEGFTISENEVRRTLSDLFQEASGRIIVAVFASNITRIQQLINLAMDYGRKVVFSGKSMLTNVALAKEAGFIQFPEELVISETKAQRFEDDRLLIITTGSQGEPMSGLTRMVHGRHKHIKINPGDTVILSSRFIPGNERAITGIINSLYEAGADVIYEKVSDIHTSGHARREELKLMLNLVRPKYLVPVHGELRHLVKHMQLAMDVGLPSERVLLARNGDVLCFEEGKGVICGSVKTGRVLVDGKGLGEMGDVILRDRRRLSEHGMVIVLIAIDETTGEIVYGPDLISRGFAFESEVEYILEDAKCVVLEVFDDMVHLGAIEPQQLESEIERRLRQFFYKVVDRGPLVLPVILPV